MREIKFRAWDKNTNTMYENISILPSMECIAINVDYDHDFQEYCIDESYVVELKDVELLEYTGLKDKNGVEIYEGDIVRRPAFVDKDCYCKVSKLFGYIEMNSYAWCVVNKYKNKKHLSPLFIEEEVGELENIEVIGNIYENKNLLEED